MLNTHFSYFFVLDHPNTKAFSWSFGANYLDRNEYRRLSGDDSETESETTGNLGVPKRRNNGQVQIKPSLATSAVVIKGLLPLMIPLSLVYFLEYMINQAFFELTFYPDEFLSYAEQYRWFQVLYQLGVFISRSSVNLIHIRRTWIFALLQAVNFVIFLLNVMYRIFPTIWLVFALILFEGLLGGMAYVNTFYRVHKESDPMYKEFSLATASIGDGFGIMLAGFSSVPMHNWLCDRIREGI